MKFQRTTAINKLLALDKRKKIIQGGTWAGKTYGIIPILINKSASLNNKHITVVAETVDAVRKGALKDFKEVMQSTGRWNEDNYHGTNRMYTFPATGSVIEFQAYDTLGKAKAAGKRTDLFINEAQYTTFEIADALIMRTSEDIWLDFNPTFEFWAHTEIMPQDDSCFCLLKYTDNEAIPQTILDELNNKLEKAYHNPQGERKDPNNIKSSYWANWCNVYIDGEVGKLEGVIFENWNTIDSVPPNAQLLGAGMDFGYTNDPTTMIAAYRYNNQIIFDEVIYQKGLGNSDIAGLAKGFGGWIYADSAEPKSIAEIKAYGVRIKAAEKGTDSIRFGINILQELDMVVTNRSANLIKELRHYMWAKDKEGNSTQKPIDAFNHGIDAMRYLAMMVLKKKPASRGLKVKRIS